MDIPLQYPELDEQQRQADTTCASAAAEKPSGERERLMLSLVALPSCIRQQAGGQTGELQNSSDRLVRLMLRLAVEPGKRGVAKFENELVLAELQFHDHLLGGLLA